MEELPYETRINLAIQAIEARDKLSCRRAAKMYNVSYSTLNRRLAGKPSYTDDNTRHRRLTLSEEDIIVQYVLDLDVRGFPLTLAAVADMANHILTTRGEKKVGKHWVQRFVDRCTEFKWFELYRSIREEYGIVDADIWNFDETGFMMGIIYSHMVVTKADRCGRAKKIQPGDREWVTAIIAASATGEIIPPYMLVKGVIVYEPWFSTTNWPDGWPIKPIDNGWTNNETGVDWIKHFEQYTKDRTQGQ
ncbi:hypothetical protein ACMFMF_011947 [Clarireedia jacksonii]